ncbi:MAG: hypothetical protein JWL64_1203 [Frankiales bacterium]|nr:hypothetical protein [Frankiales bacterium]
MSDDERPGKPAGGRSEGARASDDAWSATSLMLAGLIVWGGAGWLVGRWLGATWPIPVGILVGMAGALYLVWFRYGRS